MYKYEKDNLWTLWTAHGMNMFLQEFSRPPPPAAFRPLLAPWAPPPAPPLLDAEKGLDSDLYMLYGNPKHPGFKWIEMVKQQFLPYVHVMIWSHPTEKNY